jgi:flagellar hook-associated protein FlgK
VEQKYMDMSVEQEVKRVERLHRLADDLMDKLDQAIKELNEMCSVEHQDGEYKVVRVPGVAVDRAGAKQISSSLKDVKDLLNVRDDVAAGAPEVQVVLSDEVTKYAK